MQNEHWGEQMTVLLRYEGFKAYALDRAERVVHVHATWWKQLRWTMMWWRHRRLWRAVSGWKRWEWRPPIVAAWHGG